MAQNLASWPGEFSSDTQKLMLSLHAPYGVLPCPDTGKEPNGLKSAARHSDTLAFPAFVTRIRSPSNAAANDVARPLPERVATTVPVAAEITVRCPSWLGTQMFCPSKTGDSPGWPIATD